MSHPQNELFVLTAVKSGELEIDAQGRIWRVKKRTADRWTGKTKTTPCKKVRAEFPNRQGYLQVFLMRDKIKIGAAAHRLVWVYLPRTNSTGDNHQSQRWGEIQQLARQPGTSDIQGATSSRIENITCENSRCQGESPPKNQAHGRGCIGNSALKINRKDGEGDSGNIQNEAEGNQRNHTSDNLAPSSLIQFLESWLEGNPPHNIWIGATIEDKPRLDRASHLLNIPAKVRFLSCEPLLDGINILPYIGGNTYQCSCGFKETEAEMIFLGGRRYVCRDCGEICTVRGAVNWVICGGESGSKAKARPMQIEWARSLRDQCIAASVPFFFKQWGNWQPDENHWDGGMIYNRNANHRLLDGQEWNQMPS